VILLLPLGPGDTPRAPRLTVALVVLNALIFLLTLQFEAAKSSDKETELQKLAGWSLELAAKETPDIEARLKRVGSPLRFLEKDPAWREEIRSPDLRERLESYLADSVALKADDPFHRYGLVPAELRASRLVSHQFLHADLLHLLFNMVFLWTAGGILELSLGAASFGALYLAGGVVAGLTHVVLNRASDDPAIGASGAVAAAMGMLALLHGLRPIRVALIAMLATAPRIWVLAWPAWIFLSLWLLQQIFFASFGATTLDVAFGAHLGGFGFGALAALLLRALGRGGAESLGS